MDSTTASASQELRSHDCLQFPSDIPLDGTRPAPQLTVIRFDFNRQDRHEPPQIRQLQHPRTRAVELHVVSSTRAFMTSRRNRLLYLDVASGQHAGLPSDGWQSCLVRAAAQRRFG